MKYFDDSEKLYDLVQFGSNRYQPTHRWYNLIEGYSSEFVRRIIGEQKALPKACLDPFGGVGTTALTCQQLGVRCYSIENSPFFHEVAQAKLKVDYQSQKFEAMLDKFKKYLKRCKKEHKIPQLETETLFEHNGKKRWVFDKSVSNAILDITSMINKLDKEGKVTYTSLFRIALGAQLVAVSNVFKNGKCLSYRSNWKKTKISRQEVHQRFLQHCKEILLVDLRTNENIPPKVYNYLYCFHGDCRQHIRFIPDNSIDLVITSPPYLNSRDYTDIYRLELWVLGYVTKYEEERKIRASALTSHVQISLPDRKYPNIPELKEFLTHLDGLNGFLWNKNIPFMIKGYFADMDQLFKDMHPKLTPGAKLYINVSNSAYGGQICEVDTILAKIAKRTGYKPIEIRTARLINSSKQQQLQLPEKLRESVIVLEKNKRKLS